MAISQRDQMIFTANALRNAGEMDIRDFRDQAELIQIALRGHAADLMKAADSDKREPSRRTFHAE